MELIYSNTGAALTLGLCLPIYLAQRAYYHQGKSHITVGKVFILGFLYNLAVLLGMFPYEETDPFIVWLSGLIVFLVVSTIIFMLVFAISRFYYRASNAKQEK